MNDQKKKELESLQKLLKLIDFEVNGEIIPDESPDFLINFDEKTLGIEIVEIFQSPPDDGVYLQQQESIKEKIVEITEKELLEMDMPPIDVFISFNDTFRLNIDTSRFVLKKDDRHNFPPILVEIIIENIPEDGQEIQIYGVNCEKMPIKINSISISREEYFEQTNVLTSKGGILPPLDKFTLAKTIDSKNKKVKRYRKKCDECWLLISSNDFQFEKAFDLVNSEQSFKECYKFDFDRVYFLEEDFKKLYEIEKCT